MPFKIKLSQQNVFFYFVERVLRSHPITYIIIRYIVGKYLYKFFHESDLYGLKNFSMSGNQIILDIGANDGVSSKFFKSIFPISIIYAYEPINFHFNELKKLYEKNIFLRGYGVSKKKRKTYLYLPSITFFNKKYYLSAYTHISKEDLRFDIKNHFIFKKNLKIEKVLIETKKIEEKFNKKIFLIKIDVNGNEYDIIQSLESYITESLPIIISEVSENTYKINSFLDKFGYKAYAYKKKGNFFYKNYSNVELNLYYLTSEHINNVKIN